MTDENVEWINKTIRKIENGFSSYDEEDLERLKKIK